MGLTKEHAKTFFIVLAAVLVGVAAHQVYVAKHLAPKPKTIA